MMSGRFARRRLLLSSVVGAVLSLVIGVLSAPAALAQNFSIVIPIDTTVDTDGGATVELASHTVPAEQQGHVCNVISQGINQESTHEDNDLIVATGGSQLVLPDVEGVSNATVVGQGTLTLGSEIVISMHMGPEGDFSGGLQVTFDCEDEPDPGRIIVVKEVSEGSDTSQAFQFAASYDADGFALSDGQQNDSGDLDAGIYSVSETVPAGWSLLSAICDDQSAPNAIDLAAGETVTCTFTNVESEVDASILVTVAGACEITAAGLSGQINITMSVAGGAEVVVRDSTDQIVGSLTQDGTINVAPGATYTWEATPAAGFVFPPGFEASGSVTVEDCAEVGASILVTVGSSCIVSGTEGIGRVNVTMSVAGGADVVVRNSDGDVVGTLTGDGSIEVPEGDVYTWAATPNPGFEFPAGFDTTGSVSIETCSNPEVLPFTGVETDGLAALGIILLMAGGMTLITARAGTPEKF